MAENHGIEPGKGAGADTVEQVFQIILDRRANPRTGSYTASLFAAGENEILKKLGEEAVEVIIAAKGETDDRIIYEMADLIYHSLVLLAERGMTWADVQAELAGRMR
ncbi:MAG: phosphoribosyl-ATP diphosphatase [Litorilinea sp.]